MKQSERLQIVLNWICKTLKHKRHMTKEEVFQSGFVTAFINEYFEEQIHSYYTDKDRLLYILCESDEEKQKATKEQINNIKTKISELGFEELSFGYLQSCKSESLHDYIEPNQRGDLSSASLV